MSSKWRDMILTAVYPYWVLGEVPAEAVPYIACNDMLAGNTVDEIVAIAALTRSDLWELERLLPRVFSSLGRQPMMKTEAANSAL